MDNLKFSIMKFSEMSEADFDLSSAFWEPRTYKKGDFYNEYRSICKYLGFIETGIFRNYFIDDRTGAEKNLFFFSETQIVVAYKSFVTQTPCKFYTQAMTAASIYYIHFDNLQHLYATSKAWERFGRLIAEMAATVGTERIESMLFESPEERYNSLIKSYPNIFTQVPLYHIASYLGIQGPSLSRIRKRMTGK